MLPVALLFRLGVPTLAALVFLGVLMLTAACWVISDDGRSSRVTEILSVMHDIRSSDNRVVAHPGDSPAVPVEPLGDAGPRQGV